MANIVFFLKRGMGAVVAIVAILLAPVYLLPPQSASANNSSVHWEQQRAGNSQKRSHRWRTRRCSGAWLATICVPCEICRRAAPGQVGQRELQYQLRRPGNRQKGLRTRVWPGGVAGRMQAALAILFRREKIKMRFRCTSAA